MHRQGWAFTSHASGTPRQAFPSVGANPTVVELLLKPLTSVAKGATILYRFTILVP